MAAIVQTPARPAQDDTAEQDDGGGGGGGGGELGRLPADLLHAILVQSGGEAATTVAKTCR